MIKVMTSSCLRDLSLVTQLNKQLISYGIEHHIFIEEAELDYFTRLSHIHIKPDNGDNGGGRDGTMVRWNIYQKMISLLEDTDTIIQMDSDVYFGTNHMIPALACQLDEIKGFFDWNYILDVCGNKFHHMSGMLQATSGYLFKKAIPSTYREMYDRCTKVLDCGVCPSEDVMLSYSLQVIGEGRMINFLDSFSRHMGKDYKSEYDVIC